VRKLDIIANCVPSYHWHDTTASYSVGAYVTNTYARGQLMLILGTMHNLEVHAIVIKKKLWCHFLKSTLIQF